MLHPNLLFVTCALQQARRYMDGTVAFVEAAAGLGPRTLVERVSGGDTRLSSRYEPDSAFLPYYDELDVPPPEFRVGDESYETHRRAHNALVAVLPVLRDAATLLELGCDFTNRMHDPSLQGEDAEWFPSQRSNPGIPPEFLQKGIPDRPLH